MITTNYQLPPQKLGNLNPEQVPVEFVRAKNVGDAEKTEMSQKRDDVQRGEFYLK